MTCKLRAEFLLGIIAIAIPVAGANSLDESGAQSSSVQNTVTSTQHIDFAPGRTIHIDGSYGILHVEGWDRPEVGITVTKSLPRGYERKHPEKAAQYLESIRVTAERRTNSELAISTTKSDLGMEYEIQVPRNSSLTIHHRVGYVSVSGVNGNIEATCRRGDLVLWLSEKASYAIDARSNVGTVASDLPGTFAVRYLIGQRYSRVDPSPSRRIFLRTYFGGITIQPILPESEAPIVAGR
ncbi:MAG: hypothetical protein ABI833_17750 [Acidobacteriota bacterium]